MKRVLLVLLLAAASCGHSTPQGPRIVVHGVLKMTGGPYGVSQPGVRGRVSFAALRGRTTDVSTESDGTFTVSLPRGVYQVTGHSPLYGAGAYLCRAAGDLVVKSGSSDPVTVACDRR